MGFFFSSRGAFFFSPGGRGLPPLPEPRDERTFSRLTLSWMSAGILSRASQGSLSAITSRPRRTEKVFLPLFSLTVIVRSPSLTVTDEETEELPKFPRGKASGGNTDRLADGSAASVTLTYFFSPARTMLSSTSSPGRLAAIN